MRRIGEVLEVVPDVALTDDYVPRPLPQVNPGKTIAT